MINSLTVDELRSLDRKAVELGLEERLLIENASSNLFEAIDKLSLGEKALVIAGRGNNGADVLACGRKLASRGYDVKIAVVKEPGKNLGREPLFQKELLERLNLPIQIVTEDNFKDFTDSFKDVDFVVEGILGIGLKGEVSTFIKKIIEAINKSKKIVVACDIPSGLAPEDGRPLGAAVKADYTVTFLAPKPGFFVNQGQNFCGKIFVVDIGISKELLEK